MSEKHLRVQEIIQHLAAEFISRESNRTSLITVTGVDLSPNERNATVLLSVYPEHQFEAAIEFINRRRHDFREYMKKNSKLRGLPKIRFEIDRGEQNRQRIDELLKEDK